jgi:hypothetical protein
MTEIADAIDAKGERDQSKGGWQRKPAPGHQAAH